jgi:predicted amidohydrolase YtcJ
MATASSESQQSRVIVNARVRLLDDAEQSAEALAYRDGKVCAVGRREDVLREAGPAATVWDAGGASVLPGFIDPHQHPSIASLYAGSVQLTPPYVNDIPSLQRALAESRAQLAPGAWVVASGWDEGALREHRVPTRAELDAAVPDRPLFALDYSSHRALANSHALALAAIDRHTPQPAGGSISIGRRGLPDGLLIERAMSRVETLARASLRVRDRQGFLERLARHYRALVAVGITRVADAAVPGDLFALYREAAALGLVSIPTVLMPVSAAGYLEAPWDALEGPVTGTSDGPLQVGPLKLALDGATSCAMCLSVWQLVAASMSSLAGALRERSIEPLRLGLSTKPRWGRKVRAGLALRTPGEARELVQAAVERGFALATHAVGNDALADGVAAYAAARSALDRAGTPRFEHVVYAERELCRRVAGVGAAAVVQPYFLSLPAFASAPRIPGLPAKPLRWLLDAGVLVAGSSDFPATGFDPLDGVRAAVRRRVPGGRPCAPDQALSLDEALALYTRNAARALGAYHECGSLEVGKRADLVVLDGPLTREEDLDRVRVRATIVGGEALHGEPGG